MAKKHEVKLGNYRNTPKLKVVQIPRIVQWGEAGAIYFSAMAAMTVLKQEDLALSTTSFRKQKQHSSSIPRSMGPKSRTILMIDYTKGGATRKEDASMRFSFKEMIENLKPHHLGEAIDIAQTAPGAWILRHKPQILISISFTVSPVSVFCKTCRFPPHLPRHPDHEWIFHHLPEVCFLHLPGGMYDAWWCMDARTFVFTDAKTNDICKMALLLCMVFQSALLSGPFVISCWRQIVNGKRRPQLPGRLGHL